VARSATAPPRLPRATRCGRARHHDERDHDLRQHEGGESGWVPCEEFLRPGERGGEEGDVRQVEQDDRREERPAAAKQRVPDLKSLREQVRRMEALRAATAFYRADGLFLPRRDLAARIEELLDSSRRE
jgi:hypothetical protein